MNEGELLYRQVADEIGELIENGTLRAGERIPSVRKTSKQRGVSISTVQQAFALLESRGLIEARPRSGYYVRARLSAGRPLPRKSEMKVRPLPVGISATVDRVLGSSTDPSLFNLAAACPPPELLLSQRLSRTMTRVARRLGAKAHDYTFPPGVPELRRQIAKLSLEAGFQPDVDEIVITNGTLEALNICLPVVAKPGDAIAVESPTYFCVLQSIEALGMKAVEIPTHPVHGMDLNALDDAIGRHNIRAVVAMPTMQNPLGFGMSETGKRKLVRILRRHDLPLIEDDIFGNLHFDDARPPAAKAFDTDGRVLLCSSFSKTVAPGARVGWIVAGRYAEKIKHMKAMLNVGSPTLLQHAIAELLASGGYERHVRKVRGIFRDRIERMSELVCRHFPDGTLCTRPSGGLFLWVELPGEVDALELFGDAIEHGICVAPGPIFSASDHFHNCLRLTVGQPVDDRAEDAVRTLGRLAADRVPA